MQNTVLEILVCSFPSEFVFSFTSLFFNCRGDNHLSVEATVTHRVRPHPLVSAESNIYIRTKRKILSEWRKKSAHHIISKLKYIFSLYLKMSTTLMLFLKKYVFCHQISSLLESYALPSPMDPQDIARGPWVKITLNGVTTCDQGGHVVSQGGHRKETQSERGDHLKNVEKHDIIWYICILHFYLFSHFSELTPNSGMAPGEALRWQRMNLGHPCARQVLEPFDTCTIYPVRKKYFLHVFGLCLQLVSPAWDFLKR